MTDRTDNRRWLLAIDTSTEQARLAVTNGTETAELSWHAGRDQTVSVLAQIDRMLDLAGTDARSLAAVAVASGPGMFNGLRVGMSIAKGFHLANDAGLIGVSTLEITAYPFREWGRPVAAVVAAGRGRLVWRIDRDADAPTNGTVEELASALERQASGILVAGDLSDEQAATVGRVPGVVVPSRAARVRRPWALAEIGWRRLLAGELDDPVGLAPVYVHGAPGVARG